MKKLLSIPLSVCVVALLLITTGCQQEIVEMPAGARPIDAQLFAAAANEDAEKVKSLIESGADLQARNANHQTPLEYMFRLTTDLSASTVALLTTVSPEEIRDLLPQVTKNANKQEFFNNPAVRKFVDHKVYMAKYALHRPRPEEFETRNLISDLNLKALAPNVTIASPAEKYQRHYPNHVLEQMVQDSLWRVIQQETSGNELDLIETTTTNGIINRKVT